MRCLLYLFILVSGVGMAQEKIKWQSWGEKPFQQSAQWHKPVFLDVGTEWCTACNFMEDETYSDTAVIRLLNENFICIKADAEAQPDVGARFLQWGWPALIFFDDKGNQVTALQGNRRPKVFIDILSDYVTQFKKGELKPEANNYYFPEPPESSALTLLQQKADKQLNGYYDSLYGGWGYELKIPLYQPVEYSFWRYKTTRDSRELTKATKSLTQYARISDRVWGGVYFGCSSTRDWSNAQPEKRAEYQAGVMHNYAEAYLATRKVKWLDEAKLLEKYVKRMLLLPSDSLFCNSQEEYLTAAGNPPGLPPEKYFLLPDAKRLKYGIPPVDKTLYTDINFRMVRAFLKMYEATGDENELAFACRLAERIYKNALVRGDWFKTVIENKNVSQRIRELPRDSVRSAVMYLKTQAHAGLAMLGLYQFTFDSVWLQRCSLLHAAVRKQLLDSANGGFYSTNLMPVINGRTTQTKVLSENALYARFLVELSDLTDNEQLTKEAEGCIRSVGSDKVVQYEERLIADLTLAADKLIRHHLVFTIVTEDPSSPETKSLVKSVHQYYHPAKLMRIEKPGHYPSIGKATLFVCNQNTCSPPITDKDDVSKRIGSFVEGLK